MPRLPLATALDEVRAVATSVSRGGGRPREGDRRSLCGDAGDALGGIGPNVARALGPLVVDFRSNISSKLPTLLETASGAAKARNAALSLLEWLATPDVAEAAWADAQLALETGASLRVCSDRVADLRTIVERRGHDWTEALRGLPALVDAAAVTAAWRREPPAVAVAWLAFADAFLLDGYLDSGRIKFYAPPLQPPADDSRRELRSFYEPPELDEPVVTSYFAVDPRAHDVVFARVAMTGNDAAEDEPTSANGLSAWAFARMLASSLVESATFRRGGTQWQLLDGGVLIYANGEVHGVCGPAGFRDPRGVDRRPRAAHPFFERTGDAIEEANPAFLAAIARGDEAARAARESVRWYESATRIAEPAQRVALYARALEEGLPRGSNEQWEDSARYHLAHFWVHQQIVNAISDAAEAAVARLRRDAKLAAKLDLEEIAWRDERAVPWISYTKALERAGELETSLSREDRYEARRLSEIRRRSADHAAALEWVRELTRDFNTLLNRAVRQRNAIIHGVITVPNVIANVEPTVAALAGFVVAQSIETAASGTSIAAEFAKFRAEALMRDDRLRRGDGRVTALLLHTPEL